MIFSIITLQMAFIRICHHPKLFHSICFLCKSHAHLLHATSLLYPKQWQLAFFNSELSFLNIYMFLYYYCSSIKEKDAAESQTNLKLQPCNLFKHGKEGDMEAALHPTPWPACLFLPCSSQLHFFSDSRSRGQRLVVPWYWYLALAVVDVQGNYLIVRAYQYSSITSVTLLDCWTIPWVIILTWLALGTRYSPCQFVGVAVCVLGLGLVLLSDAHISGGGGSKPIIGDALVIAGTFCYAFSNVGEEYCVKRKDRVEILAMLGILGVLVSTCEISIFERKDLESVKWSATMICLFGGFAAATFLFYTVVPFVLQMSGATLFNLSLLTSDMWAVAIRIFFYHDKVDWLYFVAFGLVAIGLIIYSVNEKDTINGEEPESLEYERISQES